FGPPHPLLGPITLEPTQLRAGTARNVVPAEATALLDLRTTPALPSREIVARIELAVGSRVQVVSDRLAPRETDASSALVAAARSRRPAGRPRGAGGGGRGGRAGGPPLRLFDPLRPRLPGRHPGGQVRPRGERALAHGGRVRAGERGPGGGSLLHPAGRGLGRARGGRGA